MRWFFVIAVFSISIFTLPYENANAQSDYWINQSSGFFDEGGNWLDGSAPGAGGLAYFTQDATYEVNWDSITGNVNNFLCSVGNNSIVTFKSLDSAMGEPIFKYTVMADAFVYNDAELSLGDYYDAHDMHIKGDLLILTGGNLRAKYSSSLVVDGAINVGTPTSYGYLQANKASLVSGDVRVESVATEGTSELHIFNSDAMAYINGNLEVGPYGRVTVDNYARLEVENDIYIEPSGRFSAISGDTTVIVGGQIINEGSLDFWRRPSVFADIVNFGTLRAAPFDTEIRIYGDLQNDGGEVNTNETTLTRVYGTFSGEGVITGDGEFQVDGTLQPGPDTGSGAGSIICESTFIIKPWAETHIEIGGTSLSQHDQLSLNNFDVAGDLTVSLIDGFSLGTDQQFVIANVDGALFGEFNGLSEGAWVANLGGTDLYITYTAGDGNDIALVTPGIQVIGPESFIVTRGNHTSGGISELSVSDNQDVVVQRDTADVQPLTQFEVTSTSPIANPGHLQVTLEGAVFARSTVIQYIDLLNRTTDTWETVHSQNANRLTDVTIDVVVGGDVSRFVEPATRQMTARIRYRSLVQRQQFSSNTDLFQWIISP